jgi:predicted transcriptional regulator
MKVSKIKQGMEKILPSIESGEANPEKVLAVLVKTNIALCSHIEWLESKSVGCDSRMKNIEDNAKKSENPFGDMFGKNNFR